MEGVVQLGGLVLEPVLEVADVGFLGLTPIRPDSWHVLTRRLVDVSILEKVVRSVMRSWANLHGPDAFSVLGGGYVVISNGSVILEPMCCSDLGNLADWREAAAHRAAEWQTLWIGHPWVSVRFDRGLLIISDLHETNTPVSKYAVSPDDLRKAIDVAEAELTDFSRRLEAAVVPIVGAELAPVLGRQLAGLTPLSP